MQITNIQTYTNGMKKSLLDKMFFADKIDSNVFIDYGCADGSMLKFMQSMFSDYRYMGYDISDDMLSIAQQDCGDIAFTNNWNDITKRIKPTDITTVILSSIVHEIYSYESKSGIVQFWNRIFNNGFDYIVIRDMMLSNISDKPSNIDDMIKVINKSDKARLSDFEGKWGRVTNNKNLIHYLLKYRYEANWDREVEENYLPITTEHLMTLIPDNYQVIFHEHYLLPFLKERVHQDFKIDLKDCTHVKFILKRID